MLAEAFSLFVCLFLFLCVCLLFCLFVLLCFLEWAGYAVQAQCFEPRVLGNELTRKSSAGERLSTVISARRATVE